MKIKNLIDEDFIQYKKPSMFIGFPKCTFKCGAEFCQNSALAQAPEIDISFDDIVQRYLNNPITESIVLGGLDPFDTMVECLTLVAYFRVHYGINDDIIIYTGYTEDELRNNKGYQVIITSFNNIIIKYGRYVPDEEPHFDEVLGVKLASSNQYAVKYNETTSK